MTDGELPWAGAIEQSATCDCRGGRGICTKIGEAWHQGPGHMASALLAQRYLQAQVHGPGTG
jgi:hypothetical protein